MRDRILILSAIALLSGALAIYLQFPSHRAIHKMDMDSHLVPSDEMGSLQAKAQRGDCVAASRLARYYLDEALQLDTGTNWLRIAAKCPNADVKALLAGILMHKGDDPATVAEIDRLIEEIRELDPEKAARLENERKGRSH